MQGDAEPDAPQYGVRRPGFRSWCAARAEGLLYPEPRPTLWRYCLLAWPVALLPSWTLGTCACLAAMLAGFDVNGLAPHFGKPGLEFFLGAVVVGPILGTLLLLLHLKLRSLMGSSDLWAATLAALSWGLLHGTAAPPW